jgi:hypothetical protein
MTRKSMSHVASEDDSWKMIAPPIEPFWLGIEAYRLEESRNRTTHQKERLFLLRGFLPIRGGEIGCLDITPPVCFQGRGMNDTWIGKSYHKIRLYPRWKELPWTTHSFFRFPGGNQYLPLSEEAEHLKKSFHRRRKGGPHSTAPVLAFLGISR